MEFGHYPRRPTQELPKPNPEPAFDQNEVETDPDLRPLTAVEFAREKALQTFAMDERDIVRMICEEEDIHPNSLEKLREGHSRGKMTFSEYLYRPKKINGEGEETEEREGEGHKIYVYFNGEANPRGLAADKRRGPIGPSGQSEILKIEGGGRTSTLHYWEEENEDEE